MTMEHFRIHGDNIVECQRVVNYVCKGLNNPYVEYSFESPSCPKALISFGDGGAAEERWEFVLFPGFNKANTTRWSQDVYEPIRRAGGFLRETPDALVTKISLDEHHEESEKILFAVEFCSALQAGNQAWQRSGRALSTVRSGCPYLYVVDFVNYELDSETREPKSLRFPNPIVPYSFISQTNNGGTFCMQVYVRAEEFQTDDDKLRNFDESIFGEGDLSEYMVRRLSGLSCTDVEDRLKDKCFKMVDFLSSVQSGAANRSMSPEDWQALQAEDSDLLEFTLENPRFHNKKTISARSVPEGHQGIALRDVVAHHAIGIGSANLPFGIIPGTDVESFTAELMPLFPEVDFSTIPNDDPLLVCLLKGFKPRGDDDRPDRGILPLLQMLSRWHCTLMSYVYGPILRGSLSALHDDPQTLARRNGLWNALLCHSDFLLIDSPLLPAENDDTGDSTITNDVAELIDNRVTKRDLMAPPEHGSLLSPAISMVPVSYKEDDVDTALHVMLSLMTPDNVREGLCNPPGGDWSGLSLFTGECEYRWMSLPRVSGNGKRPDHVTQFDDIDDVPFVLVTESKGAASDLEENIDQELKVYVRNLLRYRPNVYRQQPQSQWIPGDDLVDVDSYRLVTAGAFLGDGHVDIDTVFQRSGCSLLFVFAPDSERWFVDIHARTQSGCRLAEYLASLFTDNPSFCVTVTTHNNE